ncbi:MAG: aspartate-semialdehyde dehydrogenase [Bdellovibrionales bacterium]
MAPSSLMNVGVVGATGIVGQEFIKILEDRKISIGELRAFAGQKSEGSTIKFRGQNISVQTLSENCFRGLDVVFFSAGNPISREWAPIAVKEGAFAIDNSSAFRMNKEIPLVVPEVNGHLLPPATKPALIANPNCSTIQLVAVLQPLQKAFGISKVVVSSYQAVSGAGRDAIEELKTQSQEVLNKAAPNDLKPQYLPHPIAFNVIPQIGEINDTGFSEEELKIMGETKKIMELPNLKITATAVRVPALNSHCEAVWVTLDRTVNHEDILRTLRPAAGIEVMDDPSNNSYPMSITVSGKDPVYVGRIRRDSDDPRTWLMWIAADNVRKGAALNGIQIAEQIFDITRGS